MTVKLSHTSTGAPVTWEQTGTEPNVTNPKSPHPVGSFYCSGCGYSASNARQTSFSAHASNCTR